MRTPSPFTLAEILLLVAIVGVVAAVALPTVVAAREGPTGAVVAGP